ncbi:ATV_HP_G0151760.mRNA.1.CDS.1 [Saccharomyces cerevisiae]|nr:ATV_HP_G0151760.mRNA.1.CDS.1 [Saccharomyces cerevisiae]CAI6930193.1 ATV_HP_G0151760.mRNA.1.CDS.1 [Saccharomyces cerevisiae]
MKRSPAFIHSIDENHHVFLNLTSLKFYMLPQNVQILHDGEGSIVEQHKICSLSDLLSKRSRKIFPRQCFDLSNRTYLNGFIGFHQCGNYDYAHSVLLLISHTGSKCGTTSLLNHFYDNQREFIKVIHMCKRKFGPPKLFKNIIFHLTDFFYPILKVREGLNLNPIDPRLFLWLFNKICLSRTN